MFKRFAALCLLTACAATASAGPMDLKGRMKAGLYEMTVSMEMSGVQGMPGGMKMPAMTVQHCVTQKDIDDGNQKMFGGKNPRAPDASKDCEMKDFKMSGDTATYRMVCTGKTNMEMDASVTFTPDGYKGTNKMHMDQNGQPMNMTSSFTSKFLGACKS